MKITWFGHSNFRLDFADKVVLIDPFFTGNPSFTGDRDAATKGATHILVTHGHADHIGDTIVIAEKTGAMVITNYELSLARRPRSRNGCAPRAARMSRSCRIAASPSRSAIPTGSWCAPKASPPSTIWAIPTSSPTWR
jgi:glyoxylase-like metal-dependent hydrolase (beta-lactamase superfamily II)